MTTFYKNAAVDLTTTNVTVVYTAPAAKTAIFKSILVSNDSGSATTITLSLTNAATAVFSLYKLEEVGALSTRELLDQPLVLETAEILKAQAATAGRLHVVASYMEIT